MRVNDFGTELGDEPRWTPGSLAYAVARRWVNQDQSEAQADAVERLARAVMALLDMEYINESGPVIDELVAAVDAVKRWVK